MTPVEIGLTVAVVVLAFVSVGALVTAWLAKTDARLADEYADELCDDVWEVRESVKGILEADRTGAATREFREQLANHKREIAKFIELANGSEQKRDAEVKALAADVAWMKPAAQDLAGSARQWHVRLEAVECAAKELAAKHLPVHASHELLTVIEGQIAELRDKVAGMQVSREVLTEYEPGIPRWPAPVRPEALADAAHAACEVDTRRWRTETANDPAGDDGEDEQVTELGEPTFVEVDERAEA